MDSIAHTLHLDLSALIGPAWVTVAYVLVYYAFMINVLRAKAGAAKRHGSEFDRYFGQDRELLAADRSQLNMLEHMPPFLILLWLHALLVSSYEATILGAIYTGSRALYPVLLRGTMGRQVPKAVYPVTGAGYVVMVVFAVRIVGVLLAG